MAEAAEALAADLRRRRDVDYSHELACAYPDGDDSNTAACAAIAANGVVLVRASHNLALLAVNDAPLRPGVSETAEQPGIVAVRRRRRPSS